MFGRVLNTLLLLCVYVCMCVFTSIYRKGFIYLGLEVQGVDQ